MEPPLYLTNNTSSQDPKSDPRPCQIHLAILTVAHICIAHPRHHSNPLTHHHPQKMAIEFHLFSFLPWELRDQIWKLAIRPDLPGAHVFRVRNPNASKQDDPDHRTSDDDDANCGAKSLLAAPQCLPQGVDFTPAAQAAAPISWTLNNPSTYLIDSGLWTACKESLLVLEKEFQVRARRQNAWGAEELEMFHKERGRFTLPETATLAACSRGSERRYVTIFPNQDLVVLQSVDVGAPHDWRFVWDLVWESFPSKVFCPEQDAWKDSDRRLPERHMALEYNPAWDTAAFRLILDIVMATAEAGCPSTLWFIDYRIKRNPRHQATELEDKYQKVFYASDRRYIEVDTDELGGWADHDRKWDTGREGPAPDDLDNVYGSYPGAFIEQLDSNLDSYWDVSEDDWERGKENYPWVKYKLLACEYLLTPSTTNYQHL